MLLEMLVIWMIVSEVARTFGKARIDAPLVVVTMPWASVASSPKATAKPQSPERKALRFSVRISLLLSSRPSLFLATCLAATPRPRALFSAAEKWRVTYSKFKRVVKGIRGTNACASWRLGIRAARILSHADHCLSAPPAPLGHAFNLKSDAPLEHFSLRWSNAKT